MRLKLFFAAISAFMVAVTINATLSASLWEVWDNYAANPWAMATLADAYSGFTIFYAWVFYRERGWLARIVWFVLIMGLGNIATALYVVLQLLALKAGEHPASILRRRETPA